MRLHGVESVSRAAETLGMSQSAVSGSLADLERQFDVQLFDRVGKRLQLSELGRALRARRRGDAGPGARTGAGARGASGCRAAARRRDADHRQLPGGAADGALHARAAGRAGHAGGGQHRGDRPAGGELRDRRRAGRGGDRAPRPGHHPLARRRAGGVLRRRASAGAQAGTGRRGPARRLPGSCASRARGPGRPSTAPCMACCPSCTSRWSCSTPRPSRGRWRRGWALAASRASALEEAFAGAACGPAASPAATSAASSSSSSTDAKYRGPGIQRWLELCRSAAP